MTQYLLNFHHFPIPVDRKPSPSEMEAVNQQWQHYIGGLAVQGKFVSTQRVEQAGSFVGPDGTLTDVVVEGKGLVVGNLTLQAKSLEEAIGLTAGCPILAMGGTVEVRPIAALEL
jgi:hypothetical protein